MSQAMEDAVRALKMRRWDSALGQLMNILNESHAQSETAEAAYYAGICLTKMKRYEDAPQYLERAIAGDLSPSREQQCRELLAYIYSITKQVKMAEFQLNRLLKTGCHAPQVYTMLAYTAWVQNQTKNAVDFYRTALRLDKHNATALNGLGFILADSGMDAGQGLAYCKEAVALRPDNAACLDSLGWAYFKNGQAGPAKDYLGQALKLAPGQEVITAHLRTVMGENGR
jgi:Tfp pilus assembly protein PilF